MMTNYQKNNSDKKVARHTKTASTSVVNIPTASTILSQKSKTLIDNTKLSKKRNTMNSVVGRTKDLKQQPSDTIKSTKYMKERKEDLKQTFDKFRDQYKQMSSKYDKLKQMSTKDSKEPVRTSTVMKSKNISNITSPLNSIKI